MYLTSFEKNIIKTLAYYEALGEMPLTLVEIRKYFLGSRLAPLFDIQKGLFALKNAGIVKEKNSLFFLADKELNADKRLKNIKNTLYKWKKVKKQTGLLMYIPYIKTISVTGSIALNNSKKTSDIDILITSKNNRIWIVRFLSTTIAFILKKRRSAKYNTDLLCMNQFITEDSKMLGPSNIDAIIKNIKIDIWSEGEKLDNCTLFALGSNRLFIFLKQLIDKFLDFTRIGAVAENLLAKLQIEKIKHNFIHYPNELPSPKLNSKNLIFYYPRVLDTEKKYTLILKRVLKNI